MAKAVKVEAEVVVGMRLPRAIVKRADAMMAKLQGTDLGAAGKVSRHTVLRLSIVRGLEVLEKEHR